MAALLGGCPDPQSRFDEFVSRVPDASPQQGGCTTPIGTVPDVTGTFLFSIYVARFPALPPIQAIATVSQDRTNNRIGINIQYLDVTTRELLMGAGSTADFPDNPVDPTCGIFTVNAAQLVIPEKANALGIDALATQVVITGNLQSNDLFCGTVDGFIQPQNVDLAGSSFGAIRVTAGQSGSQLPAPLVRCPLPDAGM